MLSEKNASDKEKFCWKLDQIYHDINDPQINLDVELLKVWINAFQEKYRGRVAQDLGQAILEYGKILCLQGKLLIYFRLSRDLNIQDELVKNRLSFVQNEIGTDRLIFFKLEIAQIKNIVLQNLAQNDPVIAKHLPWIQKILLLGPHMLPENIEVVLDKRFNLEASAWNEFYYELESDLDFMFLDKKRTLEEMIDIMSNDLDREIRTQALRVINQWLKKYLNKYSAQTLNVVARQKFIDDQLRGYSHPMEERNLDNGLSQKTVEDLHKAVMRSVPLLKRFYRLKRKVLGLNVLRWSDRNAKIPQGENAPISFTEAIGIVRDSYADFSPKLLGLINQLIQNGSIDASSLSCKYQGACSRWAILPDGRVVSFVNINYMDSLSDVLVLAHELGHSVHGLLSSQSQGPLMNEPPIVQLETASALGEILCFEHMRKKLSKNKDYANLLALIFTRIDDLMQTVFRQIGFSNFEQQIHLAKRRLSVEELSAMWLESCQEIFGPEGEIVIYQDMENLWSYIDQLHSDPFCVYGYPFGELSAQSIFSQREILGPEFENKYIEFLSFGSSKNAIESMAIFGLNPEEDGFWDKAIILDIKSLIDEAEIIYEKIKAP